MSALHVDDNNFEQEVLKSEIPVLVDFYASWCGPCKMLSPVIDELAGEVSGQAKVVKIDVDEASETAQKFNVQSIPTLISFKNGEEIAKKVGVVSKDDLLDMLGL
jgi:thioredoxin 1